MLTSLSSTIANEFLFKYEQCDRAAQKSSKYYLTVCDLMPVRCCCLSVCVIFSDFVGKAKCVQYMHIHIQWIFTSFLPHFKIASNVKWITYIERKKNTQNKAKQNSYRTQNGERVSERTNEGTLRKKKKCIHYYVHWNKLMSVGSIECAVCERATLHWISSVLILHYKYSHINVRYSLCLSCKL